MKTDEFSTLAPGRDGGALTTTILDAAALAAIRGGMLPAGGGGPVPGLHLGGFGALGPHGLGTLGRPDGKPPHCEKYRTWQVPHGTAITAGGGLVQVPFLSCPAVKRPAVPKLALR